MLEARLDEALQAHPAGLPLPQACFLVARAANAMAAQPRSVMPRNLRIRGDGGVRVADDRAGASYGYRAPEELAGEGSTPRSAVFSLGAVLVEALTGRPAFQRGSELETRIAVTQDEIPSLVGRVAQATPELDKLLARALDKEPSKRFGSTVELAEAIDEFLELSLLEVSAADLTRALGPVLRKRDPRRESEREMKAVAPAAQAPRAPDKIALPEPVSLPPAKPAPRPAAISLPEPVSLPPEMLAAEPDELALPEPVSFPPVTAPAAAEPDELALPTPAPLPLAAPQPAPGAPAPGELRLEAEPPRASAPNKPRFDQEIVRHGETHAAPARPAPRMPRPDARDLPALDESALDYERTRGGTMAPSTDPGPPPVNWLLRISLGLIALVALAAVYQLALRPLLID